MIVFIETLSLHVVFLLILLCRTKNKGNKRSLWRRGMLKLPPWSSLSKLNLLHQFLLACYCSIWNYSCTVCFQLLLSAYKRENPFPSLRRDLHEGKWLRMFFIFKFYFFYKNFVLIFICLPLGHRTDTLWNRESHGRYKQTIILVYVLLFVSWTNGRSNIDKTRCKKTSHSDS